MSKTRKKTVTVQTSNGPREWEYIARCGNYAACRVEGEPMAGDAPDAPIAYVRGYYSITHIPTGMRLMHAHTRESAKLVVRLAHEHMPKALDALEPRGLVANLDHDTRVACNVARNLINAERLKLKGEA